MELERRGSLRGQLFCVVANPDSFLVDLRVAELQKHAQVLVDSPELPGVGGFFLVYFFGLVVDGELVVGVVVDGVEELLVLCLADELELVQAALPVFVRQPLALSGDLVGGGRVGGGVLAAVGLVVGLEEVRRELGRAILEDDHEVFAALADLLEEELVVAHHAEERGEHVVVELDLDLVEQQHDRVEEVQILGQTSLPFSCFPRSRRSSGRRPCRST